MSAPIPQPHLGKAIQAAMKRKGFTIKELTSALGLEARQSPAVYNWANGKNGPGPESSVKLAKVLDLDIDKYRRPNKERKAPAPRLGPARRALVLAQQATTINGQGTILPPAPAVSDVFTFRARSDGTIIVKLDTVLPYARGVQLINSLLGFGLVIGAEDAA